MDATRFDALLRSLAVAPSRRGLARVVTALVFGGALGAAALEAAAKTCPPCRNKNKQGQCKKKEPDGTPCGKCKACDDGKCQPKTNGTPCGTCHWCQKGVCKPRQNGTKCGPGPCDACQEGACVTGPDGTVCGTNKVCNHGQCECEPVPAGNNKPVGAACDAEKPAECSSGVCGCSGSVCPCFCRENGCVGTGQVCGNTFDCCEGLCLQGSPNTCID
jgi:hypothetical protein